MSDNEISQTQYSNLDPLQRLIFISQKIDEAYNEDSDLRNSAQYSDRQTTKSIYEFSSSLQNVLNQIENLPPETEENQDELEQISRQTIKDIYEIYYGMPYNEEQDEIQEQFLHLIQENSVLPTVYSGRSTDELSSEWAQLNTEQKRMIYRSASKESKELNVEEFKYILTGNTRKAETYLDRACDYYKIVCCQDLYPDSPHCTCENWNDPIRNPRCPQSP
jgi:small-conductance mechanosensitive channel